MLRNIAYEEGDHENSGDQYEQTQDGSAAGTRRMLQNMRSGAMGAILQLLLELLDFSAKFFFNAP